MKKQLIGFFAFIGGFLLSSIVYSSPPIISEDFSQKKVGGKPEIFFWRKR